MYLLVRDMPKVQHLQHSGVDRVKIISHPLPCMHKGLLPWFWQYLHSDSQR